MDENQTSIKTLVFSGGGQTFFSFYGIIKQAHIKNFWNYNDLESLYGTSAGAMVSLFIALQIEWDVLDNYLIKDHGIKYLIYLFILFLILLTKWIV